MFSNLVNLLPFASTPAAKEASIWILGEYAEEIYTVAMNTFKKWIENFENEERRVQLEILTSAVKVFIKYPDEFETMISDLLTVATESVDNPDVRDRAFIYWRMLSTDPGKTKSVVFGYRPQAKDNDKLVDREFLNDMMKSLGYASSLFEKRFDELFQRSLAETKGIRLEGEEETEDTSAQEAQKEAQMKKQASTSSPVEKPAEVKPVEVKKEVDLLDW